MSKLIRGRTVKTQVQFRGRLPRKPHSCSPTLSFCIRWSTETREPCTDLGGWTTDLHAAGNSARYRIILCPVGPASGLEDVQLQLVDRRNGGLELNPVHFAYLGEKPQVEWLL